MKAIFLNFVLCGIVNCYVLRDSSLKRETNFGSFDPNTLYNQMLQQSQQFLSQGGTSSASGSSSQTGSGASQTSGSSSGTSSGTFDPNSLYQQQAREIQQYISSHQAGSATPSSTGSGSSSADGSISSSSSSGSSSSSASGGSFDPNAIYQQQLQQNLQNLDSTLQNANSNFNANNVNKFQASFTDPASAQLGASNGDGSGFDPDQFNTMKFNLFNPQTSGGNQGASQSSGSQSANP